MAMPHKAVSFSLCGVALYKEVEYKKISNLALFADEDRDSVL